MTRLKIKNVGPIKEGYKESDGYIDIKKLTLFIGNQGTGKSTIAKIYSTMSWIEKALVRGDFTSKYLIGYNRFKKQFEFQRINNYFNDHSEVHYIGDYYSIMYKEGKLSTEELSTTKGEYKYPKIMYIPAERNLLSTVDRIDTIKRLPPSLYTFVEEYEDAKKNIKEDVSLPIGQVKFKYNKKQKKTFLINEEYELNLTEASSGYQSYIPLYMVTRNIVETLKQKKNLPDVNESYEYNQKIRKQVQKLIKDKDLSPAIRESLLKELSSHTSYSRFINIVEEPELNLFPSSQKLLLFELIKALNQNKNNKLIMTSHSPYLISFLTAIIKAYSLKGKKLSQSALEELEKIVPLDATLSSKDISVFELKENGEIELLDTYKGLPSDENLLNDLLAEANDDFVRLLEIEDSCQ